MPIFSALSLRYPCDASESPATPLCTHFNTTLPKESLIRLVGPAAVPPTFAIAETIRRVDPIFHWIFLQATEHGYWSLGLLAFFDGFGLPIPAELTLWALAALVRRGDVALWPAIWVTATSNTLGAVSLIAIVRWGGARMVDRWLPEGSPLRVRATKWTMSYAGPALIVTRVIGFLRVAVVVMTGILRVPWAVSVPALFAGSVLWLYFGYHVVRLVGVGAARLLESRERLWADLAVAALIIAAGAAWLYWRRKRAPRRQPPRTFD